MEQDFNGMGQLHFAAIGDEAGKIEWLVPARDFVFISYTLPSCVCVRASASAPMPACHRLPRSAADSVSLTFCALTSYATAQITVAGADVNALDRFKRTRSLPAIPLQYKK